MLYDEYNYKHIDNIFEVYKSLIYELLNKNKLFQKVNKIRKLNINNENMHFLNIIQSNINKVKKEKDEGKYYNLSNKIKPEDIHLRVEKRTRLDREKKSLTFNPSVNGWNFRSNDIDEYLDYVNIGLLKNYFINDRYYNKVYGTAYTDEYMTQEQKIYDNKGFCYGMVTLAKFFYDYPEIFNNLFPDKENLNDILLDNSIQGLLSENGISDLQTKDIIIIAQLYQSLDETYTRINSQIEEIKDSKTYVKYTNDTIEKIIKKINDGEVVAISLKHLCKNKGNTESKNGHAVLAYKYEVEGNIHKIYIYDPNFPNDADKIIKFSINKNQDYEWMCNEFSGGGLNEEFYNKSLENEKLGFIGIHHSITYNELEFLAKNQLKNAYVPNVNRNNADYYNYNDEQRIFLNVCDEVGYNYTYYSYDAYYYDEKSNEIKEYTKDGYREFDTTECIDIYDGKKFLNVNDGSWVLGCGMGHLGLKDIIDFGLYHEIYFKKAKGIHWLYGEIGLPHSIIFESDKIKNIIISSKEDYSSTSITIRGNYGESFCLSIFDNSTDFNFDYDIYGEIIDNESEVIYENGRFNLKKIKLTKFDVVPNGYSGDKKEFIYDDLYINNSVLYIGKNYKTKLDIIMETGDEKIFKEIDIGDSERWKYIYKNFDNNFPNETNNQQVYKRIKIMFKICFDYFKSIFCNEKK